MTVIVLSNKQLNLICLLYFGNLFNHSDCLYHPRMRSFTGRIYKPEYEYFNRYIYKYIETETKHKHFLDQQQHCKVIYLPPTLFAEHTIPALVSPIISSSITLFLFLLFSAHTIWIIYQFLSERRFHTRVILCDFLITARVCLVVKPSLSCVRFFLLKSRVM